MASISKLGILERNRDAFVFKGMGREFEQFLFSDFNRKEFPIEYELSKMVKDAAGAQWNARAADKLKYKLGSAAASRLAPAETSIEAFYIVKKRMEEIAAIERPKKKVGVHV